MTATYPCPGIRVVRGPDWAGRDQDGGEGHVGTVVKIEDSDWAKGKVSVIWDSGRELQYRAGYDGKFELLVFDSGPTGVQQKGFQCDGCGENDISGMRWKCSTCTDFDLCTLCYNTERHDTDHAFLRCLTNNSPLVRVPPRSGAQRIRASGLFKVAKVMRGPHWKYGNQDGGEGTIGDVVKLGALSGGYSRGAVNVRWSGGQDSLEVYRIGAQGKVDLITVDETQGWRYYKAHLPVLDVVNPNDVRLKVGDKVKVEVDADIFERMHKEMTGYRDSMSQCPLTMTATYPCPGIRVVRGPDWAGRDQDGGEGHVGTVVKIEDSDWAKGKVSVIWDSGREFQYRAGYDGKFELLVFDSGPTGVQQKGFQCGGCGENDISGMRWKCSTCTDFDLCTLCYNTERHDTDHAFLRCLTNNSPLVRVPPRSGSQRIRASGLFKSAKVMRGPHWKYGNQDGGEGTAGDVVQLGALSGGYSRGAVNVRWSGGQDSLEVYRIGAQGKVDLITVDETRGWRYYKAHLPVLDVVNSNDVRLKVGDKVKVEVDADIFERMHKDLTGYRDSMSQCLVEVGTVTGLPPQDERVIMAQYPDAEKYSLVKSTLTRLHTFAVGDVVKITNNYMAAVELQNGHGGWNDKMENCLGKTGQVVEIEKDGDLRVAFGPVKWFFSPVSCDPQDKEASSGSHKSTSSDSSTSDVDDIAEGVAKVLFGLLKPGDSAMFKPNASFSSTVTARDLVIAVSNGDTETVKNIVKSIGDKVNESVDGLTALQTGCYKGHANIVELLIGAKVDLNQADGEGDTPLHYAVSGDQPTLVGILLDAKARGNTKNKKGLTPLHLAVAKKDPSIQCLKTLIRYKCDPNTQDEEGDTPLHDALRAHNQHLLDPFLECAQLNLRLANSDGSNPFHEACVSHSGATEFPQALIKKDPKIVNVPMNNALTPIHIAAFRSFVGLAGVLVKAGCNVNARDDNGKTALHMAVQRCNLQIVQLLLESGAEINVQDQEGNSPLHATHMDSTLPGAEGPKDADLALEIRCHLVERGGDITLKNKAGKTPFDFVKNKEVRVMLKRISKRPLTSSVSQSKRLPAHWETMGQDGFLKVEVSESNPLTAFEYRHVESKVEETLSNKSIVSIYRIQNVALWEQFTVQVCCVLKIRSWSDRELMGHLSYRPFTQNADFMSDDNIAKVNMEREYGRGLANEKQLFHGTTPDSADLIPHQNIDFRLAGSRMGALYGRGAYFAVDAKYSDGFAKEDARRHRFMFLAKVLVGKSRRGNPELKRPPVLDTSNKTKLANSACDKETDPRIYVIFSEGQIYPEYLIEYR